MVHFNLRTLVCTEDAYQCITSTVISINWTTIFCSMYICTKKKLLVFLLWSLQFQIASTYYPYQWPLKEMCVYILETKRIHGIYGHSLSKGIQNNNNCKSFLELLLWGQSWLVYVYRYICIITKEHQWCLWISCQAEELRLLCWANHPLSFGLGQRGLTIEVQWTPQNLKEIKHSCLH